MSKVLSKAVGFFTVTLWLIPAMAITALAEEVQPGVNDLVNALVELVKNWKALGAIGCASGVIALVVMFFKSNICGNWFGNQSTLIKRLVIVVLGQVVGILGLIATGMPWYSAIITGLFASGGAIALYEVIKAFFDKPAAPAA